MGGILVVEAWCLFCKREAKVGEDEVPPGQSAILCRACGGPLVAKKAKVVRAKKKGRSL